MRVVVASDHAGFTLRNSVVEYLKSLNLNVLDLGTHKKESCHYPDFSRQISLELKQEDRGILVCGSGIGVAIAACKSGLKCSTAYNEYTARECRLTGCQVMALGERVVPVEQMKLMIKEFLNHQ